jgi:hypothetical protein
MQSVLSMCRGNCTWIMELVGFFFVFFSKQWASYSSKNVLKREGIVGEDRV